MHINLKAILLRTTQLTALFSFLFQFTIMSRDSGDISPFIGMSILLLTPIMVLIILRRLYTQNSSNFENLQHKIAFFSFLVIILVNFWVLFTVPNWRNFYPRTYGSAGQIDAYIGHTQFNWMIVLYFISGLCSELWLLTTPSQSYDGDSTYIWLSASVLAGLSLSLGSFLAYDLGFHCLFWILQIQCLILLMVKLIDTINSEKAQDLAANLQNLEESQESSPNETIERSKRLISKFFLFLLPIGVFASFASFYLASMPSAYHALNSWYWPRLTQLHGFIGIISLLFFFVYFFLKERIKQNQAIWGSGLWVFGLLITTLCFHLSVNFDHYEFFLTPLSTWGFAIGSVCIGFGFLLTIKAYYPKLSSPVQSNYLGFLMWCAFLGLFAGAYLAFTPMHLPEHVGGATTQDFENMKIVVYVFIVGILVVGCLWIWLLVNQQLKKAESKQKNEIKNEKTEKNEKNEKKKNEKREIGARVYNISVSFLNIDASQKIGIILIGMLLISAFGIFIALQFLYSPSISAEGDLSGAISLDPRAFGVCHSDHGEKMTLLGAQASRAGGWVASYSITENGSLEGFSGDLTAFNWSRFDAAAAHINESGKHFLPSIGPQLIDLPESGYDDLRNMTTAEGTSIPENMAVYLLWLDECVRRYYWVIPDWEIGNEPNLGGFWPGSPGASDEVRMQEWCEIFTLSAEVIRAASADLIAAELIDEPLRIGSPGTSGDAVDWHWAMMTYRDSTGAWYNEHIDFICFHPYASEHTWDEGAMAERIFEVAAKINFQGTFMITEYGYMSDWKNREESYQLQAHNMVQSYTMHLSQGIEQIYWYAETDPSGHTLTYTAEDGSGRIWLPPAGYAFQTMSRLLTNSTGLPNLAHYSGLNTGYSRSLGVNNPQSHYSYSFLTANNRSIVAVLWKDRGVETARIYATEGAVSSCTKWSIYADESWTMDWTIPNTGLSHIKTQLSYEPQILKFALNEGVSIPDIRIVLEPRLGTFLTYVLLPICFIGIVIVYSYKRSWTKLKT